MISRRTNKFVSIALLFAAVLVLPTTLKATQYEVSQLASQLGYATSLLADELRYIRGFGSVRQNANRVAREAEQLIKAIQRNRSNSYIRSQFKDISRGYSDLESAFFRANRSYYNAYANNEFGRISDLFSQLNDTFYYLSPPVRYESRSYYYSPGVISRSRQPRLIGGSNGHRYKGRSSTNRRDSSRNNRYRNERQNNRSVTRQIDRDVDRLINRGVGRQGNRNAGRKNSGTASRQNNQRDNGNLNAFRGDNFDHRSPVIERQQRQDRGNDRGAGRQGNDRGVVRQGNNRDAVGKGNDRRAVRQSNGQRQRATESRRRNR